MNVLDKAFEWLQSEGYAPKREEGGIVVKYQGGIFTIPTQEEGASLLRVDYAIPRDEQLPSEEKLFPIVNAIHINVPLVKVLVFTDAIAFTSSTLVCENDDFSKVMTTLFDTTIMAVQHFGGILEHEANANKQ